MHNIYTLYIYAYISMYLIMTAMEINILIISHNHFCVFLVKVPKICSQIFNIVYNIIKYNLLGVHCPELFIFM